MFILRILVEARSIKRPSCRQIHGEISPKLKNQPSPVDPPPRATRRPGCTPACIISLKNPFPPQRANYSLERCAANSRELKSEGRARARAQHAARDNLSRVYCRDKLFMNPLLGERRRNVGSSLPPSVRRTVSIFSQTAAPVALEAVASIPPRILCSTHQINGFRFWPG